ncbi:hypothetical protein ACJJTC_011065 [Scirpophaga incertulas]
MSSKTDVETRPVVITKPKKIMQKGPASELFNTKTKKTTTREMLHDALRELNTRKGVSLFAIKKFITEKNDLKGVGASGSFKLPPKSKTEKSEKKKKKLKETKVSKTSEKAKIEKPENPKKSKEMEKAPSKEDKQVVKKKNKTVVEEKSKNVNKIEKISKKKEVEKASKSGPKKVEKKVIKKMAATSPAKKRVSIMKRKSIGSIIKAPKMKPRAR